MATPTPKFHRVATEGATTDGRKISRDDLVNMAANYDPVTKAARVNVEHMRSYGAFGDVLALKTGDVQLNVGGKQETRLALYAQIKPLDNLITLNQASQKLYSSVEIQPNFAGTGKAYLMGLAVTDNPASLGTETLQLCAGAGEKSLLAHRKQDPGNLFSEAEELTLDFSEAAPEENGATVGVLDAIKAILGFSSQQPAPVLVQPVTPPAPAAPAAAAGVVPDQFSAAMVALAEAQDKDRTAAEARHTASQAQYAALMAKLEKTTPGHFTSREPATGTEQKIRADC